MFCVEFLTLQNFRIWRWWFFDIECYELERNVKLKKIYYFHSKPMYFTEASSPGAASEGRGWQLQIFSMLKTLQICYQSCALL